MICIETNFPLYSDDIKISFLQQQQNTSRFRFRYRSDIYLYRTKSKYRIFYVTISDMIAMLRQRIVYFIYYSVITSIHKH